MKLHQTLHAHLKQHHKKYLSGLFAGFAVIKTIVLLAGFFGIANRAGTFAQTPEGELNSGNIVTEYGCSTDTTDCNLFNKNITSIAPDTFANFTNLEILGLDVNQLTTLPDGIFDNLTGLTYLRLNSNQLTSLPNNVFDNLTNLIYLTLNNNQLTTLPDGIFDNLTILEDGDISYNYLSGSRITDNEGFLNAHNITYSPQSTPPIVIDKQGDFSITGTIFNQRPIYSGTLIAVQVNAIYSGKNMGQGKMYIGVPFGFEQMDFSSFTKGEPWPAPTAVYGGPGDGCYADFVKGTGAYIDPINTLIEDTISQLLSYDAEAGIYYVSQGEDDIPLMYHTGEIASTTGLTQWSRIIVDVFSVMGQQPDSEDFLTYANMIEQLLLSGVAPSTIMGQLCMQRDGSADLNQCQILGAMFGGDLGLDHVANCGAMVYSTTGLNIANGESDNEMLVGRHTYVASGININLFFVPGDYDIDISNNMSTVHVDFTTGAGQNCFDASGYMETTYGDFSPIYISTEGSCEAAMGLCLAGDMYQIDDGLIPVTNNEYYNNASCTMPTLPVANTVSITGQAKSGSTLTGLYEYRYEPTWNMLYSGKRVYSFRLDTNNNPYLLLKDSVGKYVNGTWTQIGDTFSGGQSNYLAIDSQGIPYVLSYHAYNGNLTNNRYYIYKLVSGNRTQLGDIFSEGNVGRSITFDSQDIPYIFYYNTTNDTMSIEKFTDGNRTTVGDVFSGRNGGYLIFDANNIPYINVGDSIQKFTDGSRSQVGDSFSGEILEKPIFDKNNTLYVIENNTISKYVSGSRTQIGEQLSGGYIGNLVIDDNNIPYISYNYNSDVSTGKAPLKKRYGTYQIMKYMEGTWTGVGDPFSGGIINNLLLDSNETPYVLYNVNSLGINSIHIQGSVSDVYQIMKYTGDTWTPIGESISMENVEDFVLDSNNIPYVLEYIDMGRSSKIQRYSAEAEGASTYQWYRDDKAIGGANAISYQIHAEDVDTTIKFEVTPKTALGIIGAAKQSSGVVIAGSAKPITQEITFTGTTDNVQVTIFSGTTILVNDLPWDGTAIVPTYSQTYEGLPTTDTVQGVVTLNFSGNATFSKPIEINIPVAGTATSYYIKANHGNGLTTNGLTTNPNAVCDDGSTTPALTYNGEPITVKNHTITIYSCAASDFIAYTQTVTPSTPNGGPSGGPTTNQCTDTRDCKNTYLNQLCGPCTEVHKVAEIKDKQASVVCYSYTSELNKAYAFAFANSITTINDCEKANLQGTLLRSHMAKMMSNFAINTLGITPNTGTICNFIDMSKESDEMKFYANLACQLGLMGLNDQGTANETFNPNETVTRAQFGTVLSRLIRQEENNGGTPYYAKHLQALKDAGIMTKIDTPNTKELRGFVMLMLQRVTSQVSPAENGGKTLRDLVKEFFSKK